MNMHHYHNPVLEQRLRTFIVRRDAKGMLECLRGLSNADFRTSGYLLREHLLTEHKGEDFWDFFLTIVPADSRAYLGTFLKAAVILYEYDNITFDTSRLEDFAAKATEVDKRKFLQTFLPHIQRVGDAERILRLFTDGEPHSTIPYLVAVPTNVAGYLLFQTLRRIDHRPETLRNVCIALMKRGDTKAFALASILKAYFGLPELPGTFSLRLEPFQLSRLETSYDAFCKILHS